MQLRKHVTRLLTVLAFSVGVTHAAGSGSGTITLIGGQFMNGSYPASVYFGISPAPINRPGCSTNASFQYVFDPSTAEGKALYAALLTAKETNRVVYVYGTGTCVLGQPMEGVSFWNFPQ